MKKAAIQKYIIMTMPKSIKRQWATRGGNEAMGVPDDIIIFFPGYDARDFGSNMSYVAQSAADDGYPFLAQFGVGLKSVYVKQSAGNIALFWNWARVLKRIADSDETCLLIWDDRIPNVKFWHFNALVSEMKMRGDFYMAQLRLRANWQNLKALGHPAYEYETPEIDEELFKNSIDAFHGSYVDTYFQKGLLGYDETMVFTPAGAAWLLNQMRTMDILDVRGTVFEETEDTELFEIDPQPQQRSRLNNDNWLCWDTKLKKAVEAAVEAKRGIYTPRRIGYTFIREGLEFNSDVDWSPTGTGQPTGVGIQFISDPINEEIENETV